MTRARRGVRGQGLVIIRASFVSERISSSPARETTDHSVGVVPICPVFGPPFYITRCCPFTPPSGGQRSNLERRDIARYTFVARYARYFDNSRVKRIIIDRQLITWWKGCTYGTSQELSSALFPMEMESDARYTRIS